MEHRIGMYSLSNSCVTHHALFNLQGGNVDICGVFPFFFLIMGYIYHLRIQHERKNVPITENLCWMAGEEEAATWGGVVRRLPSLDYVWGIPSLLSKFFRSSHGLWLVDVTQSTWVHLSG